MRRNSLFVFLSFFCFLFYLFFPVSEAFAGTDTSIEDLKRRDIERSLKYERVRNSEIGRPRGQTSLRRLLVDTDDDGMPDSWELANGLDPNDPDDAWLDPDGDEVVNLFEYQLNSGLNDSLTPPVATVAPSGADYTDVETAIDSVAPGTLIRVAGGSYSVNYITFDPKVVMIQGGWSSDFTQRDLGQYPTTFDGEMQDEILYFCASYYEPVIILDGLHFVRGSGSFGAVNLLAEGGAFMKTSIFNCSIMQSQSTFSFGSVLNIFNWDTSGSDRTIANTLIVGNGASGIYSQITDSTTAHWRIINTTMSNNLNAGGDNGYGIEAFTLDNGVLTAHIYNSILWGNEQEDLNIRRNITVETDHSDIDSVTADYGATYQPGVGVIDTIPRFFDPEKDDYHLSLGSPCINAGINKGIPLLDLEGNPRIFDSAVDMGPYEGGKNAVRESNMSSPTQFVLLQNYPNPFNSATAISYQVSTVSSQRSV